MLNIHESIRSQLDSYRAKIPNILFHGPSGSGKRTLVREFIDRIYMNVRETDRGQYVMYVDCSIGNKGIKFIRDELKFFAKTHVDAAFKSIVLLNADKLTMDAQSALRRSIELFSHNTRFFMIAENKYNLMQPILSRFCEIYVNRPTIDGLHAYIVKKSFKESKMVTRYQQSRDEWLRREIMKITSLNAFCTKIYEKAYSAQDLIDVLNTTSLGGAALNEFLLSFDKRDFRSEKLLILHIMVKVLGGALHVL